jgi:F420-dependent oxidoreductase-like protein
MQVVVSTEPEFGESYESLLRLAQLAEQLGYHGFSCADHYSTSTGTGRLPGPLDAWTTLAGLARETSRLRLGTLVTPCTFRHPAALALIVAQVDAMSGGRVELGLGTGHNAVEHAQFGIPFPELGERYERLAEQLAIITGIWATPVGERFTHRGRHYAVVDNAGLPKPAQRPHPPIVLGGRGPKRTPALAAAYADELNVSYLPPEDTALAFERARSACRTIGRDPATLRLSTTQLLACGASDAEVEKRLEHTPIVPSVPGRPGTGTVLGHAAIGRPEQLVERLRRYAKVGAARVYLHTWDTADHDQLRLVADEVLPALASDDAVRP